MPFSRRVPFVLPMGDDTRDRLLAAAERIVAVAATELRPALVEAADVVAEACGTEKVDVFFHDPGSATLVALGVSTTPLAERQRALGLDRQALANGGRVVETFRTGEPYLTGRSDLDAQDLAGIAGALGVRSTLLVPIAVAGHRRGVLGLASAVPDAFSEDHLRLARVFAHRIGPSSCRGRPSWSSTPTRAASARRSTTCSRTR